MTAQTMSGQVTGRLAVPGATLHYEVAGSGPVLLLIPGGDSDTGAFDAVIEQLAADYTVVAYDPRGNSRSPYDGEPADREPSDGELADGKPAGGEPYDGVPADGRVEVSADDALALIDAVSGSDPAFVFGTDCGAITGLDLIARYPHRVRMLVAHEPPAVELLPDPRIPRAFFRNVYDTYHREGAASAQLLFAGGMGTDEDELPAPEDLRPEFRALLDRVAANAGDFFAHKLLPFTRYRPDLAALREVADKIVPAAGIEAAGHLPARPVQVLSDRLGWPVVQFPGNHVGFASHPVAFATLLARLLESEMS